MEDTLVGDRRCDRIGNLGQPVPGVGIGEVVDFPVPAVEPAPPHQCPDISHLVVICHGLVVVVQV
ncbi:hypothetical protein SDC9_155599 [bioreactor metagenome]|uniref:Uncharacterized protein n=1 Tax=bioreactor metagenome TaxID=1076179 RepID=A0A645F279_9ZZZZ